MWRRSLNSCSNSASGYALRSITARVSSTLNNLLFCLDRLDHFIHLVNRITNDTVREILSDADWKVWASIDRCLPSLAEASPESFLSSLESHLKDSPSLFPDLYGQETTGVMGRTYTAGLLWALEVLAWDEVYFARVMLILAELASLDEGGQWLNRPIHTLTAAFLPWCAQTQASIAKRKPVVKAICRDFPEVGSKLVFSLLPNITMTGSYSQRPKWRMSIPDNNNTYDMKEYWDQSEYYSILAVEMAENNSELLIDVINQCKNLPPEPFGKLIDLLKSESVVGLQADVKREIWEAIMKTSAHNKKFKKQDWALSEERLLTLEEVADILAPEDLRLRYSYTFSNNIYNFDYEDDYRKYEEKVFIQRKEAVEKVIEQYGKDSIIEFAESVELSYHVGYACGNNENIDLNEILFPKLLNEDKFKLVRFINGYVRGCFDLSGWEWVDNLSLSAWSDMSKGILLSSLPVTRESLDRVAGLLSENEKEYWVRAECYCKSDIAEEVAGKFIEYDRAHSALYVINSDLLDSDNTSIELLASALKNALVTSEKPTQMSSYYIVNTLKFIQRNCKVVSSDALSVELAYVQLLNNSDGDSPVLLETKLTSEPEFFCEIINMIYSNDEERENYSQDTVDSCFSLLSKCHLVPGQHKDGSFDGSKFTKWFDAVKDLCNKSGHLDQALSFIGEILLNAPEDPSGLFIHHSIASVLDSVDNGTLRNGLRIAIVNSRGAFLVDPSGKEERKLADINKDKAEKLEEEGYIRLAGVYRQVSEDYIYEERQRKNEGDPFQ